MKKQTGPVRALVLGAELRKLREHAGLSLKLAAAELDKSESWLSRTETGERSIGVDDVSSLLGLFGVRGSERERLLKMARDLSAPAWWAASKFEIPAQVAALQTLEARASRVTIAGIALVPGLFQTADYARALVSALEVPEEERIHTVSIRIGRQTILTEEPRREFVVYLDEAVLWHVIGGAKSFAEQLRVLAQRAQDSNVSIRIVPFDRGAHTLLDGSFSLFEFSSYSSVCYLEQRCGSGAFVHESQDIRVFETATAKLDAITATAEESLEMITTRAEELDV